LNQLGPIMIQTGQKISARLGYPVPVNSEN
jgi:IclR family transcriptional regulator, KDG regulon repressor